MAAVPIVQEEGIAPETQGDRLWVDPESTWEDPGGPGYVDVDPN